MALDNFFIIATDSMIYFVVLIVPLFFLFRKKRHFSLYLIALGIDLMFVFVLKMLINAPRPEEALILTSPTSSFPSMHASLGFFPAGFIQQWKYRMPLLVYGCIIAYSRVYLGAHYWLDVIAGSIIGFLIPWIIFKKQKFLYKICGLKE